MESLVSVKSSASTAFAMVTKAEVCDSVRSLANWLTMDVACASVRHDVGVGMGIDVAPKQLQALLYRALPLHAEA
jgi:hypothetical protein